MTVHTQQSVRNPLTVRYYKCGVRKRLELAVAAVGRMDDSAIVTSAETGTVGASTGAPDGVEV